MPKKIAVVYGGWSSEAEISRKSGKAVANALKQIGYEVYELELTRDVALKLLELKPDKVFPLLHGSPGEDGTFQGLLEILGIPYVGENVKTSAVCMDKDWTKRILQSFGIDTPRWVVIKDLGNLREELFKNHPLVVKPAEEGSSVGLTIVESFDQLKGAVEKLLPKKVLIEEFIPGKEFTCGFVKGKVLPPIEIKPKKGIYDFEAKYTKGLTEFEPVMDPSLVKKIQQLTLKVVEALEIKTLCRVDFRYNPSEDRLVVLEVNTIPGMTETSLLPKMAKLEGVTFENLVKLLIT